jgi:hypothetical protein
MLGLATIHGTTIELTELGHEYVAGNIDARKSIFACQARSNVPLIRAICNGLSSAGNGTLGQGFFLDLLRHEFGEQQARQQLDLAIAWGRYAELCECDADTGELKLDRGGVNAVSGTTAGLSRPERHGGGYRCGQDESLDGLGEAVVLVGGRHAGGGPVPRRASRRDAKPARPAICSIYAVKGERRCSCSSQAARSPRRRGGN